MSKVTDNGEPPTDVSHPLSAPLTGPEPTGDSPEVIGDYPPAKSLAETINGISDSEMTNNLKNQPVPPPATLTLLNGKKNPNFRIPPPFYPVLSQPLQIP